MNSLLNNPILFGVLLAVGLGYLPLISLAL